MEDWGLKRGSDRERSRSKSTKSFDDPSLLFSCRSSFEQGLGRERRGKGVSSRTCVLDFDSKLGGESAAITSDGKVSRPERDTHNF